MSSDHEIVSTCIFLYIILHLPIVNYSRKLYTAPNPFRRCHSAPGSRDPGERLPRVRDRLLRPIRRQRASFRRSNRRRRSRATSKTTRRPPSYNPPGGRRLRRYSPTRRLARRRSRPSRRLLRRPADAGRGVGDSTPSVVDCRSRRRRFRFDALVQAVRRSRELRAHRQPRHAGARQDLGAE